MVTPVPLSDDTKTARDRADYLRVRGETPVMSIAAELKLRQAMESGNPEAAQAVRTEARQRFDLENKVIGSMPTADFKAFHREATEGSHSKAAKLLEAAVLSYTREQAAPARADAARNVIEPAAGAERDGGKPTQREANTETLRATLLDRHGADAANSDKAASDRSHRERISVEREVIGRMSNDELKDYQSARVQGPTAAKAALDSAVQRLQADVDGRNGVRALPPLEERFNVIRHIVSKDYEFRDQPGKLAFTERPFSMRTSVDNPAAVKAMVDRAMERGWETIRVSGSSEFQRQAWIAATARGLKAVGYEPTPGDREAAGRERERLALDRSGAGARSTAKPPQQSQARAVPAAARERQVMAALDKAMRESKVPANLRDQLRAHVSAEHARRAAQGERVAVKVYDPAAPRAKPKVPDFAVQRSGERERSR